MTKAELIAQIAHLDNDTQILISDGDNLHGCVAEIYGECNIDLNYRPFVVILVDEQWAD